MLSSKYIRCLILTSYLLTIVGCVTSGNKETLKINDNEITKNEQTSLDDVNTDSKTVMQNTTSVDLNILDPMKSITLPLSLIQGYDEVSSFILQKKQQQVINMLSQLQLTHPKFSGPSYRLARFYQKEKNMSEAIVAINMAIKINPSNYYALNLKGLLLRESGEFEGSKQVYLEAIKVYPNYLNSELNLAILADIYLYDFNLALEHYERYLQLVLQTESSAVNRTKRQKKVSGWLADLKRRMPKGS